MCVFVASARVLMIATALASALAMAPQQLGHNGWGASVTELRARAILPPAPEVGEPLFATIQLVNDGTIQRRLVAIPRWTLRVVILDSRGHRIAPRRKYRWIEGSLQGIVVVQRRTPLLDPKEEWSDQINLQELYPIDSPGQYWVMLGQRLSEWSPTGDDLTIWTAPQLLVLEPKGTRGPHLLSSP